MNIGAMRQAEPQSAAVDESTGEEEQTWESLRADPADAVSGDSIAADLSADDTADSNESDDAVSAALDAARAFVGGGSDSPDVTDRTEESSGQEESMTIGIPSMKWPDQIDLLDRCREMDNILAAVLLFAGVGYAAFGYGMFKLLACLNVAAAGAGAGWLVGREFDAALPGTIIGGVLAAAIAWPLVKLAVAGCGATIGFVVGCAVWRSLGLLDAYAPAGGLIGAVFLFMLTFSLFRLSVITFTAVQGVIMLLAGLLGLVLKAPEVDGMVTGWTSDYPVALPVAIFALSVIAIFFQQSYSAEAVEK